MLLWTRVLSEGFTPVVPWTHLLTQGCYWNPLCVMCKLKQPCTDSDLQHIVSFDIFHPKGINTGQDAKLSQNLAYRKLWKPYLATGPKPGELVPLSINVLKPYLTAGLEPGEVLLPKYNVFWIRILLQLKLGELVPPL